MQRIAIVGKSKVGQSLAKAIRTAKRDTLTAIISARSKNYPKIDADILIVATRDDAIADVSRRALNACTQTPKIIVHLAGSQSPAILPNGVARLTLHPIQTFPKPDDSLLSGIFWMASSDDEKAIRWARQFVRSIGGRGVIVLPSDALPLYHAMTVFSSNFITLLISAVEDIAQTLGENPKRMKTALRPLFEQALENALRKPAKDVLTGPIKRRDLATIRRHQSALQKANPNLRKIYDAFLNYGLRP